MPTRARPAPATPGRSHFGSQYEDFVGQFYGSLVQLGVPTRAGLQAAGYSDEDIDAATTELIARGFLRVTDDPDTWQITPPRAAFSAYAVEMEQRLSLARAMLGPMEVMWRRSLGRQQVRELPPDIDLLVGVDDIAHRIQSLHQNSTARLWWAVDGSLAARSLLERAAGEPDHLTLGPPVQRRLMIDSSLLQDDAALALVHRAAQAGHDVRVGNGIPFSVVIGDDTALADLSAYDEHGQGSFETRMPSTVAALGVLLEQVYSLCTPYGPAVPTPGSEGSVPPLDARDRRILSLLTVGASDQVVARQLDVSVRTVERRVRYLMDRLGVVTRFQAGVQAVRRGWV